MQAALVPFNLADVGEGIVECEVTNWYGRCRAGRRPPGRRCRARAHGRLAGCGPPRIAPRRYVKVGDKINEFDKICEVKSDKAAVEISSRYSGVIRKLYYNVGEVAVVGKPLVDIETEGGDSSGPEAAAAAAAAAAPAAAAAAPPPSASHGHGAAGLDDRLTFATPSVRRLAKENKLDLRLIKGTGKDGRILKEDVLRYLETGGAAAPAAPAAPAAAPGAAAPPAAVARPAPADRREPVRGFTKAMIKTMNHSWKTIPHFGYCDEVRAGPPRRPPRHGALGPPPAAADVLCLLRLVGAGSPS